jgi:hypothetical protein
MYIIVNQIPERHQTVQRRMMKELQKNEAINSARFCVYMLTAN